MSIEVSQTTNQGKAKNGRGQRKSSSLPAETVEYLKAWMMSPEHIAHPYPTEQEKAQIMIDTGLELKQLTNWFVNNRKRYWKPRVEARLQQQAHAAAAAASARAVVAAAASVPQVSPVTPDTPFKPVLNTTLNGSFFSPYELLRAPSHLDLSVNDNTKLGPSQTSGDSSLHLVSEASSSCSLTHSESEHSRNEDSDTESMESEEDQNEQVEHPDLGERLGTQVGKPLPLFESATNTKRKPAMDSDASPRKRFRVTSDKVWKSACVEATSVDCISLPSLEEAAQLFGFARLR